MSCDIDVRVFCDYIDNEHHSKDSRNAASPNILND